MRPVWLGTAQSQHVVKEFCQLSLSLVGLLTSALHLAQPTLREYVLLRTAFGVRPHPGSDLQILVPPLLRLDSGQPRMFNQ
jgi:hypothetical protein